MKNPFEANRFLVWLGRRILRVADANDLFWAETVEVCYRPWCGNLSPFPSSRYARPLKINLYGEKMIGHRWINLTMEQGHKIAKELNEAADKVEEIWGSP